MSRFPGFDVLAQRGHWDAVTEGVVLRRLGPPPKIRFFTPAEEAVARPLLALLLDLRDDDAVPVFEMIDERMAELDTDGFRHADMPHDPDAWKESLAHLDADGFTTLDVDARRCMLEAIRTAPTWHGLPAGRVWDLWMRYACTAFYSHPTTWNEIGFGGPAYPRGYANLGLGRREHWEVADTEARS